MQIQQKMVMLVITLLVGGMIVVALQRVQLVDVGDDIKEEVETTQQKREEFEFKRVERTGFYKEVLDFWRAHRKTKDQESTLLYYQAEGVLDKKRFFDTIKENNLCDTIQSRYLQCGEREDTTIEYIPLPGLVKLEYINSTLYIKSGEDYPAYNRTRYAYSLPLGGYAGKSDLTYRVPELPADARVHHMQLWGAAGADFELYLDGEKCGGLRRHAEHEWDVSDCYDLITANSSINVTVSFKTNKTQEKYLGGGYFLLVYDTNGWSPISNKRYLPVMNGTIDYYSALSVRGSSPSLDVNVRYFADDPTNEEFYIRLNDDTKEEVTTPGSGSYDTSFGSSALNSGGVNTFRIGRGQKPKLNYTIPVDVVLATDISKSMDCDLDRNYPRLCGYFGDMGNRSPGCSDPDLVDADTQKLRLAQCFGKNLTEIIMNDYSGNKIGLINFSTNVSSSLDLTSTQSTVKSAIDSYGIGEETCVACALKHARELLNQSFKNRRKIVLMTDGRPTRCIGSAESCTITKAEEQTIEQAKKALSENLEIYLIGFNINDAHGWALMHEIADLSENAHFKQGNTPSEVQNIYEEFAIEIADAKTIIKENVQGVEGQEKSIARIREDSYLKLDDSVSIPDASELRALVIQEIGCNDAFDLPQSSSDMVREKVSLYMLSSNLWVDSVVLNEAMVFNLSDMASSYRISGDPSRIYLPKANLSDHNEISVTLGHEEEPRSECSYRNEIHYITSVKESTFSVGDVPHARGCHWNVEFESGYRNISLPASYTGNQQCQYTHAGESYNNEDSFQRTAGELLSSLDHDGDGIVDQEIEKMILLGGKP